MVSLSQGSRASRPLWRARVRTKKARKEISTVMKRVRRAMDDAYQDTWITWWMVLTLEQNFPVCFTRRLHLFQPPLCRRRRTLICNGKWSFSSSSSSSDALTHSLPNAAAAQFDLYSSFPRERQRCTACCQAPPAPDPLLFLRECPCVRTCSSVCPVRPPVSWAGERGDVVVTALFSSAARFRRLPLLPFKSNRRSDRGKWIILGLKITQMMPIMENYV